MASSKPTGVHYSLVIFVLLTIVCGVFWILNHKWYNEEKTKTAQAESAKKSSDAGLNRMIAQTGELKRILGIPLDDIGDDESNPNTVRGHVRARLNATAGNPAAQTYEDLLTTLETRLKNAETTRDSYNQQLKTEQETFQNKLNEMLAQIAEQKKARDLADQGKSQVVKTHEEETNILRNDIAEERRRLAELETAKEELEAKFESYKKKTNQDITELRLLNKGLTQALESARRETFETPKGQVVRIDAVTRKVWINRGKKDGLRERTTFSVYDKTHSGVGRSAAAGTKGPQDVKGSIEVTRVDENMAEARIVTEDLNRPMTSGDPIYTPLWSPGRGEAFSFVGHLDIDKDGKEDFDLLLEMVTNTGATIDNLVNQRGQLFQNGKLTENGEPKITEQTKFLVKGRIPEMADAKDKDEQAEILRMSELMSSLEKQAYERGVRIISLSDFLSFVGYVPQKRLFVPGQPYTLRSGSRNASVDKQARVLQGGETSGAFSETKKPKPNSFSGGETSRSR